LATRPNRQGGKERSQKVTVENNGPCSAAAKREHLPPRGRRLFKETPSGGIGTENFAEGNKRTAQGESGGSNSPKRKVPAEEDGRPRIEELE